MTINKLTIAGLAAGLILSTQAVAGQSTLYAAGPSLIGQGAQSLQRGDYTKAIKLTRRGLRQTREKAHKTIGYNNLCLAYRMTGEFDQALKSCDQAVDLQPGYWRALTNRGNVFFHVGNYFDAEKDYKAALALRPTDQRLQASLKLVRREIALNAGE